MNTPGRCFGIGVGPGDPELMTLKAARHIASADVIVSLAKKGAGGGNARRIANAHIADGKRELALEYPVTTEALPDGVSYEGLLIDFYDASAKQIAELLEEGLEVGVLCEGDPLFYGSFMYLLNRLAPNYEVEVVPGVSSMLGAASVVGSPIACLNEVLTVLSGVLSHEQLVRRLQATDCAVIMKLGRNLERVRGAVEDAGMLERAIYVERATMENQKVSPLRVADAKTSPYFSLIVIPSASAPTR